MLSICILLNFNSEVYPYHEEQRNTLMEIRSGLQSLEKKKMMQTRDEFSANKKFKEKE